MNKFGLFIRYFFYKKIRTANKTAAIDFSLLLLEDEKKESHNQTKLLCGCWVVCELKKRTEPKVFSEWLGNRCDWGNKMTYPEYAQQQDVQFVFVIVFWNF